MTSFVEGLKLTIPKDYLVTPQVVRFARQFPVNRSKIPFFTTGTGKGLKPLHCLFDKFREIITKVFKTVPEPFRWRLGQRIRPFLEDLLCKLSSQMYPK
jgi:hypothetical protein